MIYDLKISLHNFIFISDDQVALHDCQLVFHKCKEGGQLYMNPDQPDTSVFLTPALDNKDVAETMIQSIDTGTEI